MSTVQTQTPPVHSGFEPLRPYGQPDDRGTVAEDIVSLQLRLTEANERNALLEEQRAAAVAERDQFVHRVTELENRNRELAADLDSALEFEEEHALDSDHERLASPRDRVYVNAFAAAAREAEHENGYDR
jgi:hypothetical protein